MYRKATRKRPFFFLLPAWAVISGMDFDALAERSEYREDLWFPPPF